MRFGVDLGGTKIEIIALDNGNQAVFRHRVSTPKGDYVATVQAIVSLYELAVSQVGERGRLGVGIPGAISKKTGRIKNANSVWLIGQDLKGDLVSKLNIPVKMANDANCFALSEASDGAAKDTDVVFGVIIGTGCGAGLIVNGEVVSGVNSISGEWGHNPLPWMTETDTALNCYCGLHGCNETFLSGTGFERHFQNCFEKTLSAKEIMQKVDAGDSEALQHFNRYCEWLAKGLASVINVVDPDVIVLGGGMGNIDALYEKVPALWHQWVFSDLVETRLVKPVWGDSSGVRGAAWL